MFRSDEEGAADKSGRSAGPAVIGGSLTVNGEITGQEDLLVQGRLQGQIDLPGHQFTVATGGKVKAQVRARVVVVEGELQGNVVAERQAIVRSQGRMQGDIQAPAVVLEDGCLFRGKIDMAPEGAREIVSAMPGDQPVAAVPAAVTDALVSTPTDAAPATSEAPGPELAASPTPGSSGGLGTSGGPGSSGVPDASGGPDATRRAEERPAGGRSDRRRYRR